MTKNDSTVAVAIDRDKNSQHAVRWAVDNLSRKKNGQILLIHVHVHHENIQSHSMVANSSPTMAEMQQFFLPYRGVCARKGIQAKEVILQDTDVAQALTEYISQKSITTVVLGSSTRNALTRAFKVQDVPSSLSKSVPEFCSIYAISRGKVLKLKSASQPATPSSKASSGQSSQTGSSHDSPVSQALIPQGSWGSVGTFESLDAGSQSISSDSSSASDRHPASQNTSPNYSSASEHTPKVLSDSQHSSRTHSPDQSVNNISEVYNKIQLMRQPGSKNLTPMPSPGDSGDFVEGAPPAELAGSSENSSQDTVNSNLDITQILHDRHLGSLIPPSQHTVNNLNLRTNTKENSFYSTSGSSNLSGSSNYRFSDMSFEHLDSSHSVSDASRCSISSQYAEELEEEMKKLKFQLKQSLNMYNETCRRQAREIDNLKSKEACNLEEAKEASDAMLEKEKQKSKAALEVARMAQHIAELESKKRKCVERQFQREAEEKKKEQDASACSVICYRTYSTDEIEAATNYFSTSKKIGEGGYGPVYKGYLDHTAVAIKVLRSDITQGQAQFQQEIEVLSRLRHPNVVLLLGACPEYGCLVYECMENGSLEDRLFCKNKSPPIPWPARFRIAAEIAAALHFFHRTKPEPIVHRDLKPANILLDASYRSMISDVGLARLVPASVSDSVTQYLMTSAAGTFCYIDPEYQQTGMLNTKSDIYSLGIMLLQIITARPPMGLTHHVQRSIEKGNFDDILDPSVNDWPLEEALSFAKLALKCCELRRKDRPDLGSVILPELERLKNIALDYRHRGRFTLRPSSSQESLASSEEIRSSISDGQSDKAA